jgi:hypothetical protein
MSEYPSAECKSVEFHPCDSRVGKLAAIRDADTFPFVISKFSSVVPLLSLQNSIIYPSVNSYHVDSMLIPLIPDNPAIVPFCIYLLSMIYRTHPSSPYFFRCS